MTEPGLTEQLASLNQTLHSIEARLASGELTRDGMQDFKTSLDEFRLRVWGLLSAGSADDAAAFLERFRLRRARDMCRALAADLDSGALCAHHAELTELGAAAEHLARRIEEIQRQ
jgi:hypothetical protein